MEYDNDLCMDYVENTVPQQQRYINSMETSKICLIGTAQQLVDTCLPVSFASISLSIFPVAFVFFGCIRCCLGDYVLRTERRLTCCRYRQLIFLSLLNYTTTTSTAVVIDVTVVILICVMVAINENKYGMVGGVECT
jgi:uncharacterized Tic20 family protein